MNWELIFVATNAVALLGWLALVLLPRRDAVLGAVLWMSVGLLCAAYLAMFAGLLGGLLDDGRIGGAAPAFEYSVQGLMAAFASPGVLVLGWTHYLAFDLFVGLWIARDADQRGAGRLVQLPFFLMTFLAGPIGLFGWLVLRLPVTRR